MTQQKTINKPVDVQGLGLFSGVPCSLRFVPAPADSGIVFVRTDEPKSPQLAADWEHLSERDRRTSLANGSVTVDTIEHLMAAVWGLGIDNIKIEMSAPEPPSIDGSAMAFVEALQKAGVRELDGTQAEYIITEPVSVSQGDASLTALAGPTDCLDILYDLNYNEVPSIGRQVLGFRLDKDDFLSQIAPARTFLTRAEADEFLSQGMGTHLTTNDLLVFDDDGPADNSLRFADEPVRHKICDMIGDLALLGRRLRGRIVASKSGHDLNHMLVGKLLESMEDRRRNSAMAGEPHMDIRGIMRLLPHRYPFLMIDRIIEIDGDQRAVGIKNVSINEPFFQGHYPGQPIMPGVLVLEALAQLSGILLSRRLEHTGKVAMLVSMDRVKIRRPVRPGDQLIIEAEMLHVRSRTGHCRCKASVGGEIAAEAEIKFMLVDDDRTS